MAPCAKILLLLFAVPLLNFALGKPTEDNDELISVAVLFRHGDRSPKTSFPNDEYFDLAYWPMGFKQLTNSGKERHFELGRWFRNRYSSFLPEDYSPNDIYIRSSDVDRTLMSAAANLAGLYPPTKSQVWNSAMPWQPIPVHTTAKKKDFVISMKKKCKKYDKEFDKLETTDFFININEEHKELYDFISQKTGWDVTDVGFIKDLQSIFYSYGKYNASFIPSWYDTLDKDEINYLSGLAFAKDTYNEKLKRLRIGPFWDFLITQFDNVIAKNEDTAKFLMLSGHETTIAAVLNSIGAFDYLPPEFASVVIWELRKKDETYYFNMFYKKESGLTNITPAGCQLNCKLNDFKILIKPIRVNEDDWADEC